MSSIFDRSETRLAAIRDDAKRMRGEMTAPRGQQIIMGGGRRDATPFGTSANLDQDDSSRARRQYAAFSGSAYTAIRPIMNLGAEQSFRVGFDGSREDIAKDSGQYSALFQKWIGSDSFARECKAVAPGYIAKSIGENVTPLNDHFLLKLLAAPNERLTGYSLKQLSIASVMLTGRMVWWFDASGAPRTDYPELGTMRLWYIPRSWIRPAQNDSAQWIIQAPNSASSVEVNASELFLSTMADPGNPFMPFSPLQSQATSVDTDDKILKAQAVSMENAMHPNLVVTVGRLPGMPGTGRQGPRPMLHGEQRQQIVDAIKMHLEGVEKWGEPLILDALIESVHKFMATPAELDMVNSQKVTSERVMHGLGTSMIMAGQTDNANRAGAVVAEDIFYRVTLNPILSMISQDMDSILGPRFSAGRRLRIWIDSLEATDMDATAARVQTGMAHLKIGELRSWMQTGKLKLTEISDEEAAKFVGEASAPAIPNDPNKVGGPVA